MMPTGQAMCGGSFQGAAWGFMQDKLPPPVAGTGRMAPGMKRQGNPRPPVGENPALY